MECTERIVFEQTHGFVFACDEIALVDEIFFGLLQSREFVIQLRHRFLFQFVVDFLQTRLNFLDAGVRFARFGGDGRELFYVSTPRNASAEELIAVPVKTMGTAFEAGAGVTLLKVPMIPNGPVSRDYDISLDGQRFLVGTVVKGASGTPVTIVLNWPAGLKK